MDYFDEQNVLFYDFLNENFKINKEKNWDAITKNITTEKIKLTYRYFAKLFPLNFNYTDELTKTNSEFTSIHYGMLKANRIIDEVIRFSLYSEKIIVFHPIQNPVVTDQSIDPRRNPKYWLQDFLDSLYFYTVIQKWVKTGIIKLIVNPYDYDLKLRDEINSKAQKRASRLDFDKIFETDKDLFMDSLAEQFVSSYQNKSKDYIFQNLLNLESPRFTEEQAEEFTSRILKAIPKANPLNKNLSSNLKGKSSLFTTKGGGPLESIILISEKTGGNIYTPSDFNWNQIKEFGINDFWVKTNKLYSEIPLNFLNNVDTNFALELRKEGRLSGVRQELKKIYKELENIDIENLNPQKLKFIQEGFVEELKKAESEWLLIKKQAEISRKQWLTANIGIPIITNQVSFLPMAVGSLAWLYMNEKSAKEKLKNYRIKTPTSVFIDLKNREQSFFTELKNCIL
jgi:hypothetical protein